MINVRLTWSPARLDAVITALEAAAEDSYGLEPDEETEVWDAIRELKVYAT
jgi:hypothetical protein